MAMKTASILCLISIGLLVSIIQQADSMPAILDCYGRNLCSSECTVLPSLMICRCSGSCIDLALKDLMESGYNKSEAEKKLTQVIAVKA